MTPDPFAAEAAPATAPRDGPSLAVQFGLAGGAVMLVSGLLIGAWVSNRIEDAVVRNSAAATALYMESFISPISQDLARSDTLSPGARRALDEVFENTPLGQRVLAYKIWKPGGLIIAASDPALVGQRFPETDSLRTAFGDEVHAEFDDLDSHPEVGAVAGSQPLLEIYSPVHEVWSGRTVAVVEFYEVNEALAEELAEAKRTSWVAVAGLMALIGGVLYGIVLRGSRTIDRQKRTLTRQLADLHRLSEHNAALRRRVQGAAERVSAMNDHALRRIGSDLHDGPAQLLALAALRLDAVRDCESAERRHAEATAVGSAIDEAMREIRAISKGLLLPEIAERPVCEIVNGVVEAHARRTGTEVAVACRVPEGLDLSEAARICVYRFVQEGLSNAWQHAGGRGQAVTLDVEGGVLTLSVADRGPGLPLGAPGSGSDSGGGMGLTGLRDRVESLGGVFIARRNGDGPGAEVRMELNVQERAGT